MTTLKYIINHVKIRFLSSVITVEMSFIKKLTLIYLKNRVAPFVQKLKKNLKEKN